MADEQFTEEDLQLVAASIADHDRAAGLYAPTPTRIHEGEARAVLRALAEAGRLRQATPTVADDAPLDPDERLLYDLFRRLGCPSPVDPVDTEDCASMAGEIVRVQREAGRLLPAGVVTNAGRRYDECADGSEHVWIPLSFVFESQLLDGSGRVIIRQPSVEEGRVYCVCMGCHSHTYVVTEWVGYYLSKPEEHTEDTPDA